MNTRLLKVARRAWVVDGVPRELQRRNIHHWVAAVRLLGNRWVLSKDYRNGI
jgi:hypothetical protein